MYTHGRLSTQDSSKRQKSEQGYRGGKETAMVGRIDGQWRHQPRKVISRSRGKPGKGTHGLIVLVAKKLAKRNSDKQYVDVRRPSNAEKNPQIYMHQHA